MNESFWCHPDRKKDRVSREMSKAYQNHNRAQQIQIIFCTRYTGSKRGAATEFAKGLDDKIGGISAVV